jgi:16S rRNA processing protein RimM
LEDEAGNQINLEIKGRSKATLLAEIKEVRDRTSAEQLKGVKLFVPRDALPATEDNEFYHTDLVGLSVYNHNETLLGTVIGVHDFGAGNLIDVDLEGLDKTALVPFNKEFVPSVDLNGRRLTLNPIPGLIDEDDNEFSGELISEKDGSHQ